MLDRASRLIRTPLVVLSSIGLLLLFVGGIEWVTGGFNIDRFGLRIRANSPLKPITLGVVLVAVRFIARRVVDFSPERALLRRVCRAPVMAAALSLGMFAMAIGLNYGVGGGADSYGYVSQADQWIAGDVTMAFEWLRGAPWPHLALSATPLGYTAAADALAAVPVYPPGLPWLLAVSKTVFGQCGIVLLIAAMAGLLTASTYAIGKRVASSQVGVAAAWLVATSPVVIFSMSSPMSDVPAAAMTALGMLACLRPSRTSAWLAGLSMSVVTTVRPNLVPLTALMGLWLLTMDGQIPNWRARLPRTLLFGGAAALGPVSVALVNNALHGGPTQTGYGNTEGFFLISNIAGNARNYSQWLFESQTPLMGLGLVALIVPVKWLFKASRPGAGSLLLLMVGGLVALYLPYGEFGAWWFLRFYLPAWPALAIGAAWLCTNRTGLAFGRVGVVVLLLVGGWGVRFAHTHEAFTVGRGDLRYVSAAHMVQEMTPPSSVILSFQHSGSVMYYGGRKSLRYDWIEPHWLEETVGWLKAHGHEVYVLVEDWEVQNFRARFAGTALGALPDDYLIFRQDIASPVSLYDTRSHDGEMVRTITDFVPSARRCCEPAVSRAAPR